MNLNLDKSAWKRVALGDVAVASKEKIDPGSGTVERYIAGEHMDTDDLQLHRWGCVAEVDLGPAFHRKFGPGQVLYGSRRTYLRKVAVADFHGVCANTTFVVDTIDPDILSQRFLPFIMSSEPFHSFAAAESKGSVNPYVNWSDIQRFEFDLPPLKEQDRIADLLWAVEQNRRSLNELHVAAAHTYKGVRIALLRIGPHSNWRHAEWTSDEVDHWTERIPEGWSAETIAGVGRVRAGATPNRSRQALYFDGGKTPWVKTLDLNESVLMETEERITSEALAETSATIVPAGTVLVAMYGGFAQIGRTARLGVSAATNQAVSAILELRGDVDPEYLHEVIKAGRPKWRKVAASSRKDPNITKRDVEGFSFPLPPLDQQHEILEVLGTVRHSMDSVSKEKDALAVLRSSLIVDVFGGS